VEGSGPGGGRGQRVGEGCHIWEGLRVGDEDACQGRGGRTLSRPSSPAMGDCAAHVSGRRGASERSGAARRRRGARRGEAVATMMEEEWRDLGENG
jgi:hypothetical protein